MKIKFIDVGRGKASWIAECPIEISEAGDWFYRQVKPHLASRNIEFMLDASADGSGIIFAGFHIVGRFELIRENAEAALKGERAEYEHID